MYRCEKKAVSRAHVIAFNLLFFLLCALTSFVYAAKWGVDRVLGDLLAGSNFIYFSAILIVSIYIHEFLHYFPFRILGRAASKNVEIKFNHRNMVPYVRCSVAVSALCYRVSAISPFILLGLVPVVIGFLLGCSFLFFIGVFQIYGSAGDFMLFFLLLFFDKRDMIIRSKGVVGFVRV